MTCIFGDISSLGEVKKPGYTRENGNAICLRSSGFVQHNKTTLQRFSFHSPLSNAPNGLLVNKIRDAWLGAGTTPSYSNI